MRASPERVLVFHTAFIGDIVLMLPLLQVLRRLRPESRIAVVTVPAAVELVRKHPAVDDVIPYDKRGKHRGWRGMGKLARELRARDFSVALVPHRSLRSAAIVRIARIPRRIGFSTSAGAWLFTDRVAYGIADHEIDRNLSLLHPLTGAVQARELPVVAVEQDDASVAGALILDAGRQSPGFSSRPLIGLAPGSVWLTKRWPARSFAALARLLTGKGYGVVLFGGERDAGICDGIAASHPPESPVLNVAGKTSLAESAALLQLCRVLVSNDSAPMHLAMGVGTPVVGLFGPTVPAIGFAPVGPSDCVLQVEGLSCRPCNIHGGNECPIGSFECMRGIPVSRVAAAVHAIVSDHLRE